MECENGRTSVASSPHLAERTEAFAVRIVRLVNSLPRTRPANVIGGQQLPCATSVGANYRAARRARSRREFWAKLEIAEEEGDESVYWLEILLASATFEP